MVWMSDRRPTDAAMHQEVPFTCVERRSLGDKVIIDDGAVG